MDNKPITHYERIISQPVNEFANWLARFCGMQSEDEKRNLLEWLKEGSVKKQDATEELSKERKTGKWEVDEVGCGICSACGNYAFETTTHHISGWYPRFCPNCGAQMIGGDDDV